VSHRNAPLSETGRLRLARCIVEEGWSLRRAAERFQVAVTTAARWAGRYREMGEAGMADRSSRPHRSPNQTPTRTERRIIKVRVTRRWGPARIAYLLGLNVSTVHRVLTRYGLAKLRWLDRPTGRVIRRMESASPGDLVHVDIKKLGKIPAGGGWRKLGKTTGRKNSRADKSSGITTRNGGAGRGYHFLHTAVDAHSRLVYSEILTDERKQTAADFWLRANAWFAECGIVIRNVLTDNGSCIDLMHFAMLSKALNIDGRDRTGPKPTAKSNDSTAPWPTNGPTPGSTSATLTAARSSHAGCITTITTAATQHSRVNHPPAAYLTSQVSTTDM
jgi:transposase